MSIFAEDCFSLEFFIPFLSNLLICKQPNLIENIGTKILKNYLRNGVTPKAVENPRVIKLYKEKIKTTSFIVFW